MAQELFIACANEDSEEVERILQDEHVEVDVDYQGYFSEVEDTLLLYAARNGKLGIVQLLLKRGADANLENKGETPLSAAITGDHWEIAKTLLGHEDLDVCTFDEEDEWSPLHLAVRSDRVDIVRLILDKDQSCINQRDKSNQTPLDLALQENARNCVHVLLKHGARTWESPPLCVAASLGHLDFMKQLLRSQAVDELDQDGWTALHHAAYSRCDRAIKLLLSKNADPNRRDKETFMPLHRAVYTSWVVNHDWDGEWGWTHRPHLETVQELLACSEIDVNAVTTTNGWSALHYAVEHAWVECVDLLLRAKAETNIQDEHGQTPLFLAIKPTHPEGAEPVPCVRRLIQAGADADVVTKDGETALHRAIEAHDARTAYELAELLVKGGKANVNCVTKKNVAPLSAAIKRGRDQVVELLLKSGADMTAASMPNHSPSRPQALAVVMRETKSPAQCYVAIARSLCARGAKWDQSCDGEACLRARGAKWDDWCSGMRASVEHWAKQFDRGVDSLTDISVEVVQRGAKSVEAYLERAARSSSKALLRRCKICVIGPTEWGKTTLVKAMTTGKGASVHPGEDGRTVGIDLQPLEFTNSGIRHEVTLWDFAGQNEYQGAHSLFFSPRSLYLLCVDLEKYRDALKANNKNAMRKFVRDNIFRWVRAVTARHEKPTFVAVGTKLDQVERNEVKAIWKDLQHRWTQEFDLRLEKKIVVNNYDTNSVSEAVEAIKPIISDSGIDLPADDVRVLKWIRVKRGEAEARSIADRVGSVMWHPKRLQTQLLKDIPDLRKAEDILKLLHDLGDVYWHESTVIIDPSLLLEFVKEIITHNCDKDADEETKKNLEEGRVCHKSLSEFPHWKCLVEDEKYQLMLDLKCLLQHLRLAYPDKGKEMKWNSDLIVPAYWKRQDRKPSKGLLRDRSVVKRRGVAATFEYWLVYKLPPELSDVVFEQFAVQNRAYRERVIWRNMIEDSIGDCVATVTLEHADLSTMDEGQAHNQEANSEHSKTSRPGHREEDTINLQVAGSDRAQTYLLFIFDAMEKVLGDYVGVSRFVKDPTGKDHKWEDLCEKVKISDLLSSDYFSSNAWLPPNFKEFTVDPSERRILRVEASLTELLANSTETVANTWKLLANYTVLENLLRATDSQRKYPTRWTLMYNKAKQTVEIRMLCDYKEKCHHDPTPITIKSSDFLAKNSKFLRGCAWLATALKKVVTLGLLDGLLEKLISDFQDKIDKSEKTEAMVSLLDLSQGGEALVGEKVSEPIAAWFLHELLTIHDDSFKVEKLPLISGLGRHTTPEGILIWVHRSEIPPNTCVQDFGAQNASSSGVFGDPSTAVSSHDKSDEPVQQPEEEDDPSSDASSAKKPFSALLRILDITGLIPTDEHGAFVYCAFEESSSGSKKVFCSLTTPRHSDESCAPSWEDMRFYLKNIASLKQLAECNLRVEVKRPHSVEFKGNRDGVTLFSGSTFLATLQDGANPRTVVVELAKKKKLSMKCEQVKVSVEFELA